MTKYDGAVPVMVDAVVVGDDIRFARDVHPARRLEADHVRAQVGEDARARRPREHLRQVDHTHALERQRPVYSCADLRLVPRRPQPARRAAPLHTIASRCRGAGFSPRNFPLSTSWRGGWG